MAMYDETEVAQVANEFGRVYSFYEKLKDSNDTHLAEEAERALASYRSSTLPSVRGEIRKGSSAGESIEELVEASCKRILGKQ